MASNSEARKRREEAIASERLLLPDEIEALRTKHQLCDCAYCNHDECRAGCVGSYPCDVIKVLDYAELLEHAYEHAKAMGAKVTVLFAQSLDELVAIRGSSSDQIPFDTEQTEIRNEHSNIRASATSDILPEYECDHLDNFQQFLDYMEENDDPSPLSQVHWWLLHKRFTDNNYCGKCGKKR